MFFYQYGIFKTKEELINDLDGNLEHLDYRYAYEEASATSEEPTHYVPMFASEYINPSSLQDDLQFYKTKKKAKKVIQAWDAPHEKAIVVPVVRRIIFIDIK